MRIRSLLRPALLLSVLLPVLCPFVRAQDSVRLSPGLVITESVLIEPDTYVIPADSTGAVVIRGTNITVDFGGAVLDGNGDGWAPDAFEGTGILVEGENVTVLNAVVRGYKVGLFATGTDGLRISTSDFSYNYRQRLKSTIEREHLDDWMSYHDNENDEWLRYGAAVYVRDATGIRIDDVRVTGGQNGLMLTRVNDSVIYNNEITFNSGIGIGLYRSSRNDIQHNRLDWNVRGYSHGVYNRGQDSAAILMYEQSSGNVIARNSATHSGDGLFLWAGQTTMDTGSGGANDNLIWGNDFSFAPTNGIEVTFSRNRIIANRMEGCWHGIWGGYSFHTQIVGNVFVGNDEHISIEHGQRNVIAGNAFEGGELGVYLWERDNQPADWGYSQNRDVRSLRAEVRGNVFESVDVPLRILGTDTVAVVNNTFSSGRGALDFEGSTDVRLSDNTFDASRPGRSTPVPDQAPPPIPGGRSVWGGEATAGVPDAAAGLRPAGTGRNAPPPGHPWSRKYILVDEWGPVDFRSPVAWPRSPRTDRVQTFEIAGPSGEWRLVSTSGVDSVSARAGETPGELTVRLSQTDVVDMRLDFEFTGDRVVDRFGNVTPTGEAFTFTYEYFFVPITWNVSWWSWEGLPDPRDDMDAFRALLDSDPIATETTEDLGYQWYGAPAPGVGGDHFATRAVGRMNVPEGRYRLDLTSDDGVRVWVDGRLVHDDWTYHAPRLEQIELDLGGEHEIRIEQFEISGYATLVATLTRIRG